MAIFTQNPDYTAKIVNVNETVVGESYKMSQVIADFNAIGIDCDSVIMHDWRGRGYGAFIPLKITEQNTYYVGDNDLTSGLGTNATLWQKSNTVWSGHYYRYVNGVPADYGALSLGSQTVDNIEYWYDYDGNVSYIPLFYLDSSITVVINNVPVPPSTKVTSNGGGATHIAKVTGQLKDLSSNLSDILMVSGGGGGGLIVGETAYTGKEAGGISGSGDNSADQTTGNAFGLGESGTNVSGGGSGLYGGYKGTSSKSGGAGSGYIGNSLLSNKKMVGYNVPTSSAEGTKTESVNEVSASAVSGKPKSGNGFARIKFLREIEGHIWSTSEQVVGTWINGEPLYEITFYKDSDFAYNNMNNLGALPQNFERMVYARGYVQRDGNTEFDVFNTGDVGPVIQIKVYNGYFGAYASGYAIISMAITFRYTKSSN